jgi:hypothetical protein
MKPDHGTASTGDNVSTNVGREVPKKDWQSMSLTYAGEAKDLVRGGTGKLGVTEADIGDTNKPKGKG